MLKITQHQFLLLFFLLNRLFISVKLLFLLVASYKRSHLIIYRLITE